MAKLDIKDRKILHALEFNARLPASRIAKKVGLSSQGTDYRIKRLEEQEIIQGHPVLLNIAKMGFLICIVYLRYENVDSKKEKEIIKSFKDNKNVAWALSIDGKFDLEVLFFAKNIIHFNKIMREVVEKHGEHLRNRSSTISINTYHYDRSWLVNQKRAKSILVHTGEPNKVELDNKDMKLINLLHINSKMSHLELGSELELTPNAVKHRMKTLESKGIIKSYRTLVNTSEFGMQRYKAMLKFKYVNDKIERQLVEFCKSQPEVLYLVTCIGDWNVEIDLEAKDNKGFREFMTRLRNQFVDIIQDYDTIAIYATHRGSFKY